MVKENNGQIHHATDPRREMPIFEVNLISWNPFNNLRELSAHCNPRQLGALHQLGTHILRLAHSNPKLDNRTLANLL